MNSQKLSSYAPILLRFTLTAVFAWFDFSQLTDPASWIRIVPEWAMSLLGMDAAMIVKLNGTFEVIAGFLLAIGFAVRYVSILLFLHLIVIASTFGNSPTGIRDFGLSFATLALALFGQDKWSLYPKVNNDGAFR
ncbi:MAG: DoxX family membrane protein [Patescibacteria group bacterium]